jgi:hypothetical protein
MRYYAEQKNLLRGGVGRKWKKGCRVTGFVCVDVIGGRKKRELGTGKLRPAASLVRWRH